MINHLYADTEEEKAKILEMLDLIENIDNYFDRIDMSTVDRGALEMWIKFIIDAYKPIRDTPIAWQAIDYGYQKMLQEESFYN